MRYGVDKSAKQVLYGFKPESDRPRIAHLIDFHVACGLQGDGLGFGICKYGKIPCFNAGIFCLIILLGTSMKLSILLLCTLLIAGCADHYRIKNGGVEFVDYLAIGMEKRVIQVHGADPNSFTKLNEWYAKDSHSAYWMGTRVEDADPTSFKIIDNGYGRDRRYVFRLAQIVEDADPITFELLQGSWSRDSKHYFYNGTLLEVCEYETFRIIDEFSPFRAIDGSCYYWESERVEVNEFSTFEILSGGYARDETTVYFQDRSIQSADPGTFEVRNERFMSLAKDHRHCYSGSRILDCSQLDKAGRKFCGCGT